MEFLQLLAQYRTHGGDVFFQLVTNLAQELFVVGVICWLFWCTNKKLAYTLGFSYFSSGLLVQGLKITFRIPRPWILDPEFAPVASAVPDATGYSFPSGHTQSITALFGTLGLYTRKIFFKILSFFIIFLVGFSRMYLGCHTPKDVLTSFVVSILCCVLCHTLIYRKESFTNHTAFVSLCLAAACLILTVYAVVLQSKGTIDIAYAQDCLKASGAGLAFALGFYIENTHIRFALPASAREKVLRLIIGLLAAVIILEGLKPLIGTSLPACFIRYFLAVFWILVGYPFLFTRFAKRKSHTASRN